MANISHDGFEFSGRAGMIEQGPIAQGVQEMAYPGVAGVQHLIDKKKSRQLRCRFTIDAKANKAAMETAISAINAKQGELTGTLTGPHGETYEQCTFLGFVQEGPAFYSAGGTVGLVQRGTLNWIQRKV